MLFFFRGNSRCWNGTREVEMNKPRGNKGQGDRGSKLLPKQLISEVVYFFVYPGARERERGSLTCF